MRAALVVLCLLARTAHAEPVFAGEHGRTRLLHLGITFIGGVSYPAFVPLQEHVGATCRWCDPTDFDLVFRDALRWENTDLARTLSDLGAYTTTPALSLGLVLLGSGDASWGRVIDDVVPIFESMVIAIWVSGAVKMTLARQRPSAHFGTQTVADDSLGFPSAHASTAFAFATSAGVIARHRGYATEPYVWIGGLTLAAATGYLRIAADRHYALDVLAGGAIGAAAGLTVPLLMRRPNVAVVPSRSGLTVTVAW